MAKRFTDTDKWKKPFIRGMEAPYKLLWLYILDDCDHAGIWQVDIDVANIKIGISIDIQKAIEVFGSHIQIIDEGEKWFISDFIDFQYGELKQENRVHNSILAIHKKYKIKPLKRPLEGAKDKDKEKDKEKDLVKDKEEVKIILRPIDVFPDALENVFIEFLEMRKKIKKPATEKAIKLLRDRLRELSLKNQTKAIEILNQSIRNNWQDLYHIKQENQKNGQSITTGPKSNPTDAYDQLANNLRGNTTT